MNRCKLSDCMDTSRFRRSNGTPRSWMADCTSAHDRPRSPRSRSRTSGSHSVRRSTAAATDQGMVDLPRARAPLRRRRLVPDVTGWRRERMPRLPTTDYVTLVPDWVCEVLSAETRRLDLVAKRPVYAREDVAPFGSSTRPTAPSRHSNSGTASGCSSPSQRTMSRSASAPSTRSPSASASSGPE